MSLLHHVAKCATAICLGTGALGVVATASAEDVRISLPAGARATITVTKVDDSIVCDINGAPVVGTRNALSVRTDITNFLHAGSNALRCRVYDNDGGSCYGYDFRVTGTEPAITRSFYCCNDAACARHNPVLDETYTVTLGGR